MAVKIIQSESHHFFRDKICRRHWFLVFLVFVVLNEKLKTLASNIGKSEKRPGQKESNCNNVCRVCQINLKVTYDKCLAKACGNIFKLSARKEYSELSYANIFRALG